MDRIPMTLQLYGAGGSSFVLATRCRAFAQLDVIMNDYPVVLEGQHCISDFLVAVEMSGLQLDVIRLPRQRGG